MERANPFACILSPRGHVFYAQKKLCRGYLYGSGDICENQKHTAPGLFKRFRACEFGGDFQRTVVTYIWLLGLFIVLMPLLGEHKRSALPSPPPPENEENKAPFAGS